MLFFPVGILVFSHGGPTLPGLLSRGGPTLLGLLSRGGPTLLGLLAPRSHAAGASSLAARPCFVVALLNIKKLSVFASFF